ncbi:MAG: hypothetical protein ACPGGE_00275, partial [Poseidonia sp.]
GSEMAVDETVVTEGSEMADDETVVTEGSEMADDKTVVTEDKDARRAVEAMVHAEGEAHNAVAPPMGASEEPKASALAMPTTAHHVISEPLVPLNVRKTERT